MATVTFTATDECGLQITTQATFHIVDSTPPNIVTTASDLTMECSDPATNQMALQDWLDSNGGAVANDICHNFTWSSDFTGLTGICDQTAFVTFTALDECGNSASTSATISIVDTDAPDLTIPNDIPRLLQ